MSREGRDLSLRGGSLRGRSVTVMGLGLLGGGVEVARALARAGARVTVTDLCDEDELRESVAALADVDVLWALGEHREADFTGADVIVANPAVPPASPYLAAARTAGAEVTSEIELFLEACPARIALVTGTQGKSTTAHLAAGLLRDAGIRAHLGGNIGRSLLGELDRIEPRDAVVLEVSSYQLEALPLRRELGRRVAVACVTNVLVDHLERHGSPAAYEAAKRRAIELPGPEAALLLPAEDERVRTWDLAGRRVQWFSPDGPADLTVDEEQFTAGDEVLGAVADLHLTGEFQRANALAALGIARALGARPEQLAEALGRQGGLEHRLQALGTFAGHPVWDNGVSTTPDSTRSALLAIDGPLTLVCGGRAKDLALEELASTAARRARRVVTFGESGAQLAEAFRAHGLEAVVCPDVPSAVREAFAVMEADEPLLFSPACASFDAHRNFEERAAAFRAALPPASLE